jgi:hypothetical protein
MNSLFFNLVERTDAMKYSKIVGLALMFAALTLTGCSDSSSSNNSPNSPEKTTGNKKEAPKNKKEEESHSHGTGPNGGVVFDMGKYHAEFTVDHPAKEATVLFIDGEEKSSKPLPVAAEELTLTTKETKTKEGKVVPPMTVKLLPKDAKNGKASKFVGTDPGIGNVADFEGTVTGKIDDKPASGEFKE